MLCTLTARSATPRSYFRYRCELSRTAYLYSPLRILGKGDYCASLGASRPVYDKGPAYQESTSDANPRNTNDAYFHI